MALTDKLSAIADAIRSKTGKTDGLTLEQMPGEIERIQTGGGDSVLLSVLDRSITEFRDESITEIRNHAFRDCTKLAVLDVPNLTELGTWCLSNTVITRLNFPKLKRISYNSLERIPPLEVVDVGVNCTYVYSTSMRYCNVLKTLILRRTDGIVDLLGVNAFTDTPFEGYNGEIGTVYVPQALIESYQAATNWSTLYAKGTCNFVAIEGSEYE